MRHFLYKNFGSPPLEKNPMNIYEQKNIKTSFLFLVVMGRFGTPRKRIWDVQREFSEDFTVVNETLLLCKFCNTIVKWHKKTRIYEHLQTKMHAERKESKLIQMQESNLDQNLDQEQVFDASLEEEYQNGARV